MKQFVDQEVPLTLGAGDEPVKLACSVSSELMEYQLPQILLDASAAFPLNTVQDDEGFPMILTVMAGDSQLYVVMRIDDTDAGWRAVNLTGKLNAGTVNTYAVSQAAAGGITVAVSMAGAGDQPLWVSDTMSNAAAAPERWENIPWHARPDARPHAVRSIHLGTNDDGRGFPLMIVATSDREGADLAQHYLVETDPRKAESLWGFFPMPENAQEIVDLAVGTHVYGRGVYTLYRSFGELYLTFTSVKDAFGKTHNVDLPVPPNARSLDTLPGGTRGVTDLYVGGDGVHLIPNNYQLSKYRDLKYVSVLAAPEEAPGVRELVVRDDALGISVWALDGKKQLQYIKGTKSAKYGTLGHDENGELPENSLLDHSEWEGALVIGKGVERLAPIRNRRLLADTVLLKRGENEIVQMTQTPQTRLWMPTTITLPSVGEVQEVRAYVTHLQISKEDGSPYLPDVEQRLREAGGEESPEPLTVRLSASDFAQVEVNGRNYTLNVNRPVEVSPDSDGNITIISRTDGIATPFFYLDGGALKSRVVVNPAEKVNAGLKRVRSGDDLKNVTLPDGSPLVDPAHHAYLGDAASGIKSLTGVADDLPKDGRTSTAYLRAPRKNAPLRRNAFGMSFHPETGLRYHAGERAFGMMRSAVVRDMPEFAAAAGGDDWFWQAVRRAAGDVIEWARNSAASAFEFIVRQVERAWQLALKIGGQIYRFVVESVSQVYGAINWLLKATLGIDLDKFIKWLGFLFDWEDIKATKAVISSVVNYGLDFGAAEIHGLGQRVEGFFEHVVGTIKKERSKLEEQPGVSDNLRDATRKKQDESPGKEKSDAALDFARRSPGGNFGNFVMQRSGIAGKSMFALPFAHGAALAPQNDLLADFFDRTAVPLFREVEVSARALADDLKELFAGGVSARVVLEKLAGDAAVAVLNVAKRVITGLLGLAEEVVRAIRNVINYEVELPFITALYKKVTGSERMTMLDAFSLIFAVPATTFFKLVGGRAPFPKGGGEIPRMGHEKFFEGMRNYGTTAAAAGGSNAVDVFMVYSWVGGIVSSLLYDFRAKAEVGAACLEQKIPAAVDAPLCLIQILLTAPLGKWSLGNIAGWVPQWALLVKNLYDICSPGETRVGSILKIIISILRFVGKVAKDIYTLVNKHDAKTIVFTVWKFLDDGTQALGGIFGGVAGLIPAAPPESAAVKYGFAVAGAVTDAIYTGSTLFRVGASTVTEVVMENS